MKLSIYVQFDAEVRMHEAQVLVHLRHYATGRKVTGSIPDEVIAFFKYTYSFQSHYGPGVDSASNRNEYQESFWG
jgi:hypothetical protein